jgi:hypothetical protein
VSTLQNDGPETIRFLIWKLSSRQKPAACLRCLSLND